MIQDGGDELEREGVIGFSCPDEVAKRIADLYGDERLADVTFIVKQGDDGHEHRFVGHRNIISTWSKPLDRMLCGDFVEGSSKEVHIRDVEPSAFEAMLKLMYCGKTEITVDNVLAILDVSVRFDVAPLVQFSVQFLQNHTSSEHACRMLEVGVQYSLVKLMDKCIELIVTDDHILESEDFNRLSQAAVVELARHDSWNMHEDEIYDTMVRWAGVNSSNAEEQQRLIHPILEHLRYPHMSVEKLKSLTSTNEVPSKFLYDALFFKLDRQPGSADDSLWQGRHRPRPGSLLFSWVPTTKVTVSGSYRESARHTSSNGFTGVRGNRRMQQGVYSWNIDIVETHCSWIFVGVVQADDPGDVAWRSSGRMLYCLDSRFFHQGAGQNHVSGDRKISSGDCIRVVLDCTNHTLAFGINSEEPVVLFRDLAPVAYVPAVDLRDCGDKVCILSSSPKGRATACPLLQGQQPGQAARGEAAAPLRAPEADEGRASAGFGDMQIVLPPQPFGDTEASANSAATIAAASSVSAASSVATAAAISAAATGRAAGGSVTEPGNIIRRSAALEGLHQPHNSPHAMHGGGTVASTARTLQPRQSQGPQGGAPTASVIGSAQERSGYAVAGYPAGGGSGVPATASAGAAASSSNSPGGMTGLLRDMDPEASLYEDHRDSGWDGQAAAERENSVPPM